MMNWFFYIAYFLALVCLGGYGFHRLTIIYLYLKHKNDEPKPLREFAQEELPIVTFQLPCFNEKHVIKRLINSVAAVDYPQEKLHIQLLDDSTDETVHIRRSEVAKLVAAGFDAEHIHRVGMEPANTNHITCT